MWILAQTPLFIPGWKSSFMVKTKYVLQMSKMISVKVNELIMKLGIFFSFILWFSENEVNGTNLT